MSLLLAALLLATPLLVGLGQLPSGSAQVPVAGACLAKIEAPSLFPSIYLARGQSATLTVFINATNAGVNPARVRLEVQAYYAGSVRQVNVGGFTDQPYRSGALTPPVTHSVEISLAADAPPGLASIELRLIEAHAGAAGENCLWNAQTQGNTMESSAACGGHGECVRWGFWVDQRPGPVVTGVQLVRHDSTASAQPDVGNHDQALSWEEQFTRYPTVTDATGTVVCNEGLPTAETPRYSEAHVLVNLTNMGDADLATPNGTQSPVPLRLLVLDNGFPLGAADVVFPNATDNANKGLVGNGSIGHAVVPAIFFLHEKGGVRNITVVVDPQGELPEASESDNAPVFPVTIRAPRITGEFVNVHPQGTAGNMKLTGSVIVRNNGTSLAGRSPSATVNPTDATICFSRTGTDFVGHVYLDVVREDSVVLNVSATLGAGEQRGESFHPEEQRPLDAGPHRIIFVPNDFLDLDNVTARRYLTELGPAQQFVNETCCSLPDLDPPRLQNVSIAPSDPFQQHVGGWLNVSGNVIDDSNFTSESDNVYLDITYPGDANATTFVVPHNPTSNASGFLTSNQSRLDILWWFNSTYDRAGTYNLRVRAVDAADPPHVTFFPPLAQAALQFTLSDFPRNMGVYAFLVCKEGGTANTSLPSDCVAGNQTMPEPRKTFANATDMVSLLFRVPPGSTGLPQESHNPSRITVQLTDPDGEVMGNFSVKPQCWSAATNAPIDCLTGGTATDETCSATSVKCYNYLYNFTLSPQVNVTDYGAQFRVDQRFCGYPTPEVKLLSLPKPSEYNITVWVGDASCRFTAWNLTNTPPYLDPSNLNATAVNATMTFELVDPEPAVITQVQPGSSRVNAGQRQSFSANITDNIYVKKAFVLLYNGTGDLVDVEYMNNTHPWLNESGVNLHNNGTWETFPAVPTGFDTALCNAGAYRWRIGAQDAGHNISYSATDPNEYRTLQVDDVPAPTVTQEGAFRVTSSGVDTSPSTAYQAQDAFVLQADVVDDTCFTVQGVITDVNTNAEALRRDLTRVAGTHLYRSANVATGNGADLPEGAYRFTVIARDSAGHEGPSQVHDLVVVGNLPPQFSFLTPPPDGFGTPNGTIRFDVGDPVQGVDLASINVSASVNGAAPQPVGAQPLALEVSGSRVLSYRVAFTLPTVHGDIVAVAAEASDGTLAGNRTWSFTVDGVAPRGTLACSRSYPRPCGEGGSVSVAPDTVFTLTAVDTDPAGRVESGVAGVRVRADANAAHGTEQLLPGASVTFTLPQLGATADGVYTLHAQAVDNAGNAQTDQPVLLSLDSQGPVVQSVLTTPVPQGLNITASISDVANDVRSATLNFRTGQGAYEARPLLRIEGTQFWYAVLSGARRGVQVCYFLEATDFLNNTASNGTAVSPNCLTSENHQPLLTVTSPRDGEAVQGAFTVRWQVSDLDGDPVTVSLSYRRASDVQLVVVPVSLEEQGQRSKTVNVTGLVEGDYLLKVDASDNQPFNNRTTRSLNFTVGASGAALNRPVFEKGVVAPGEDIKVRVELGKPVDTIVARLLKDDVEVQRKAMDNDPEGSRFYTATFRVTEPGLYQVEVQGTFDDGTPFTLRSATPVRVQGAGLPFGGDTLVIVAVGAAVVALAAAGLRRRGML
jgi:hypothetical protein